MIIKGLGKWIAPVYHSSTHDYTTRFEVYYGSAGSGKSYFCTQKLALKALESQRKILVVRKVGNTLKDSVWALYGEVLNQLHAVKTINKSEMKIELINGSQFIFKGLDDPEKIKSIVGITDIFIEEATELTLEDFSQLNLRLRSKAPNNQILLAFNPVSKTNWVFKYFFEKGAPENTKILKTTYRDNPHLPEDYIESLKALATRNPAYYKIYVEGEFATLDKLVFPIIHKQALDDTTLSKYKFWIGLDWGYTNDPTAITWGYYNPDGMKLYITGEFHQTGMTNDKIADVIKELEFQNSVIIADSSEPKSIQELKNFGIRRIEGAVKGPDSVMNGLDRLMRCEIYIDPQKAPETVQEFENYAWKKNLKTNEYENIPIDAFNHHIDSIRYGTSKVMDVTRKAIIRDKRSLGLR